MRTSGIEPEQRAWKALIITSRSHPHVVRLRPNRKITVFSRHIQSLDNFFYFSFHWIFLDLLSILLYWSHFLGTCQIAVLIFPYLLIDRYLFLCFQSVYVIIHHLCDRIYVSFLFFYVNFSMYYFLINF